MNASTSENIVLFVDDERFILKSMQRGLIEEPYQQLFANSAREALGYLERNEISVIVSDLRMPQMGGMELLEIVKDRFPHTIRIVLTAYTHTSTILAALNSGYLYNYITKPFKVDEDIIPVLKNAIDIYNLEKERRQIAEKLQRQNIVLKNSEERKTIVLKHLTKKIIPYVADVVYSTLKIQSYGNTEINEIVDSLNSRGEEVLDLLKKVETILK